MNFFPMFVAGLATSVHCVFMCGPLVLTYAIKGTEGESSLVRRLVPNVAYQGAKIVSYMAVGLALGMVGAALGLAGVRGYVTVFAGVFMILLGFNMTGRFPLLRRLTLRPPAFLVDRLGANRARAKAEAAGGVSLVTPITFGLLTGLMPCGPLQAAQFFAAGTGTPLGGMVAMLGFGLGTAPLMLGFGTVSGMLGDVVKRRMQVVAAVIVVVLGLMMLDRGAMILGSPVTFESIRTAAVGGAGTDSRFARGADGVVEIPLTIRDTQYHPSTLALPAGQRIRLVVDRQEDVGCSAQLAIPQLGVLADLKPNGTTFVDVPAVKPGRYTLTCGMGMMSGTLEVGGGSGNLTVLLLAGAAVAGLGYVLLWPRSRPAVPEKASRPHGSR